MSTQQTDALQCAADLEYSIARHGMQDAFTLNAYKAMKMVRTQHARIIELEAQLESIGAGGVSGPLIGQPQAMPDLSQLTERGAKAWAGVDAQEPCQTCAALARTVMLDQVSFDRKPDCYGIRQITDDEGVEEWEDIRTSPDVAREEAKDMMATGRGEIYEVVPLWTTPQPAPAPLSDAQIAEMMRDIWGCASIAQRHALEFARAVERAHGITQKGGAAAQPAAEASRFGSPELQAMIIARCVEKDQADSVQEDAARLEGKP